MDLVFKNAIIVSIMAHSMIIFSLSGIRFPPPRIQEKRDITVDYVVIKEQLKVTPAGRIEPKRVETPKMEVRQKVDVAPPVINKSESGKREVPAAKSNDDIAKAQERVKSTKDYINYYQLIREKIRQHLKASYRDYYNEGEVTIRFTLDASGILLDLNIDYDKSTKDKALLDIAASSVKEASPFAPFPNKLNLPKMTFDLDISFRK